MKYLIVLISLVSISANTSVHAQRSRLDSLLARNAAYQKEDSVKVLLLIDLYKEYRKLKQLKERLQYSEAAINLGEKIKFTRPLPPLYNVAGLYYEGIAEYEKSIANYTRAIELAEQVGDKEHAAGYSLNLGTVYQSIDDYPRALALYQKAANYYIITGNESDAANCYINMGGVYEEFASQNVKSVEFINKALTIFSKNKDEYRGIGECLISIVQVYLKASDAELKEMNVNPSEKYAVCRLMARKAMDKAITQKQPDETLQAEVNALQGRIAEQEGNYSEALGYLQAALDFFSKADRKNAALAVLLDMGRVYRKQNNLTASLQYLQTSLSGAKKIKVPDLQKEALFNISAIKEQQKQFDSAYFYYCQYIVMRDSISNTEKQKEITRRQLQFDFGIKEREYQLNQQIADEKIKAQQGLALRQEQEIILRNKQLELTRREKEIQKLNYLQKQSELENAQKLQAVALNKKELEKRLQTQTINQQKSEISEERKITAFLGLLAIVVSGAAFFVFRAMRKTDRLNKLVLAQKDELEEMGKVKDKIFSIVSHDMRAPVNNLVAFSHILEEGHVSQEKLSLYIDQIKGTLDHTSSLMENLLNWAASQMQGFTPVIEQIALAPILDNVLKGAAPALQKKKIELVNTLPDQISVTGDKTMVELIIRNMINNAIKFTELNGRIEVAWQKQNGHVQIEIADNGVGISPGKLEQINGDAVRSLESTSGTAKEKGTGLGLMLSKHFAAMMHGKIMARAREEKGTLFALRLPEGNGGEVYS